MEYLTWYNVLFVILAICVVAYGLTSGKAKEWLKYAVLVCEQELGSGTGQAKLRRCYDLFIEQFPVLASVLPFSIFSKWVDLALEWMRIQLENNENLRLTITGI